MKEFIKGFIPDSLLKTLRPYYHGLIAIVAHYYFGQPSKKLTVIGVTGTAGKSTTINALAQILNSAGLKTGFITTANYSFGEETFTNTHGLSMPSGWKIAAGLKQMTEQGCKYAIIEATSEGLAQNRHLGINFQASLITNLAKAHLDAHNGFENYKKAKARLFTKTKMIGVNLDDDEFNFFLQHPAQKKFGITLKNNSFPEIDACQAELLASEPAISFNLRGINFNIPLIGKFNAYNILMAVACANELGVSLGQSAVALKNFGVVPGRMEEIQNNLGIKIFVDYAPEPVAMQNALEAAAKLPHNRIIHVFGATGGHRDKSKRFEFGEISARLSDTIIITNDDVYDSNPSAIAQNIVEGIERVPGAEKKSSETIIMLDRRAAIGQALRLAKPGDILIITGKGSEQFLVLPGDKRIPWDEREVVKEELTKLT
jgi:UDP-N-acetylmuramoyl-L-alanyl-D-glutamate--2,6-diaminopimelate ligase